MKYPFSQGISIVLAASLLANPSWGITLSWQDVRPAQKDSISFDFQEQALAPGMTNWIQSFAADAHVRMIQWRPLIAGPADALYPTAMWFARGRSPAGSKKKNGSSSTSKNLLKPSKSPKIVTRRGFLSGLGAAGALAGIAYWLHITPEKQDSSASPIVETRDQRIQRRLVASAQLAVQRINMGFLGDSPDKKEILTLLENFIRAPRILPRLQNPDVDYGYLSVDINDGGAIRVDYDLFDRSSDDYDDALLIHEFTHQVPRQVARQKQTRALLEESKKDPYGFQRDGSEGDHQRHNYKKFIAMKSRNEGEAHENEVARYARGIAQFEGVSFADWLSKKAVQNPYFGIFKKFLKPDGTVPIDDVTLEMVMQGIFINPNRQYGLMVIAWKEGILSARTIQAMGQRFQLKKENLLPYLDPEESRRFQAWLGSWLNDPAYYNATSPAPNAGFIFPLWRNLKSLGKASHGARTRRDHVHGLLDDSDFDDDSWEWEWGDLRHYNAAKITPMKQPDMVMLRQYFAELHRLSGPVKAVPYGEIDVFGNEGLQREAVQAARQTRSTAAHRVILGTGVGLMLEYALHADADAYIADYNPEVTEIVWPLLLLMYQKDSRLDALSELFSLSLTDRERGAFQRLAPGALFNWAQVSQRVSREKLEKSIEVYTDLLTPWVDVSLQPRVRPLVTAFFSAAYPQSVRPLKDSRLDFEPDIFFAMDKIGGTLTSERNYQAIRRRIAAGGIHVATLDLSSPEMDRLADLIRDAGQSIVLFYPSNVLEHFRSIRPYVAFFRRLQTLPVSPDAMVVRGYSGSTQTVESFDELLRLGQMLLRPSRHSFTYRTAFQRAYLIVMSPLRSGGVESLNELYRVYTVARSPIYWSIAPAREQGEAANFFRLFSPDESHRFKEDQFHSRDELKEFLEATVGKSIDPFDFEIIASGLERLGIMRISPATYNRIPTWNRLTATAA